MDAERYDQLRALFLEALELPEERREAFARDACGNDETLLAELLRLIQNSAAAGTFLERSPLGRRDATNGDLGQVGPYRLLRKLGSGGFGVVYEAMQETPIRRRVAVKVLKPGVDSQAVLARFEFERQILARFDHPGIAKIFDAGVDDRGSPFFAMELVRGEPITDYCDRHRLSTRERLDLFREVCLAVHHAHQKGVIHRDLKPSNILVTVPEGRPVAKVIDFGVAKAVIDPHDASSAITQIGQFVGTLEYMSPEQADLTSLDIDTRSDIYSLGVILYELLIGALPFDRDSLRKAAFEEVRRILCDTEPPTPTARFTALGEDAEEVARKRQTRQQALIGQLRGELELIPMMAMRKDRTRRYQSASELAEDIERFLGGREIRAVPESAVYRMKKFVRRNRGVVAASGMVLVTLFAVLLSLVLYFRAEEASARRSEAEAVQRVETARAEAAEAIAKDVFGLIDNLSDELEDQPNAVGMRLDVATAAADLLRRFDPDLERYAYEYASMLRRTANAVGDARAPSLGQVGEAIRLYIEAIQVANGKDTKQLRALQFNLLIDLSDMQGKVGAYDDSRRSLEEAMSILHGLKPADDDPARLQWDSTIQSEFGELQIWQGRASEADQFFRTSLEMKAALKARFPDRLEVGMSLAKSRSDRADAMLELQELGEALAMRKQAHEQRLTFKHQIQGNLRVHRRYVLGLCKLVAELARSGEHTQAAAQIAAADDDLKVLASSTTNPRRMATYCQCFALIGEALALGGDHNAAVRRFNEAVDGLGNVVDQTPEDLTNRDLLVQAVSARARSFVALGEPDDARADFKAAIHHGRITVEGAPQNALYASDLAANLIGLARLVEGEDAARVAVQESIAILEQLEREGRLTPRRAPILAEARVLLSEMEAEQ